MIRYTFGYGNPQSHFIEVELELYAKQAETLLKLPSWRPGRYQIQNFAKNLKGLAAKNEQGEALAIEKINKDTWVLRSLPGLIRVSYSYYAFKMDAGNSWLDEEQLYINFINCALYSPEQINEPCQVDLKIPHDYRVATGLKTLSEHSFESNSYYELVDSPLIASPTVRQIAYEAEGYKFNVWVQGDLPKTDEEVVSDFQPFTELQLKVMKGFPCPEYHFLVQSLPYKHYHGVEHLNSTTITIGPSDDLRERARYREFLGVSSHELFHTWNVIRIRPAEMCPYDFTQENYHETGFVTEGVTTYYGDLFLKRSGVFSNEEYLAELNKLLKRHYDNEGRKHYSVAASSYDLWLDGYERGIPGRKVSIYNEGALAAMILDLSIRLRWNNARSLDDVMRAMWTMHEEHPGGYHYQDYQQVAESVYGETLDAYFQNIISGTAPYEDELAPLFKAFGLTFSMKPSEKLLESKWGIRLVEDTDRFIIDQVAEGSPGEFLLSSKDEILLMNGEAFKGEIEDGKAKKMALTLNRLGRKVEAVLESVDGDFFGVYQVDFCNDPSDSQLVNRTAWLGIE